FIGYVGYSLYRTENYRGPTIASRLEEITREMKKTAEIMEDTNAKLDTLNVILKRNYIRELERDLSTK
ncbi:hypothetical protein J4214_03505, partial [Candidatus Woesearchaeota archaeon]|nr:hypothetical protein [Candidatus Woesearchaeota archaeon]